MQRGGPQRAGQRPARLEGAGRRAGPPEHVSRLLPALLRPCVLTSGPLRATSASHTRLPARPPGASWPLAGRPPGSRTQSQWRLAAGAGAVAGGRGRSVGGGAWGWGGLCTALSTASRAGRGRSVGG